ncbi:MULTISPECIES: hypothetical protein [unclassified Modestobacter]
MTGEPASVIAMRQLAEEAHQQRRWRTTARVLRTVPPRRTVPNGVGRWYDGATAEEAAWTTSDHR